MNLENGTTNSSENNTSQSPKSKSFSEEIENIKRQAEDFKKNFDWKKIEKMLLRKINQWQKESIKQIRLATKKAQHDVQQRRNELKISYDNLITRLSNSNDNNGYDIEQLKKLLEECRHKSQEMSTIEIKLGNLPLSLIKFENIKKIGEKDLHSSTDKQHAKNGQESSMPPTTTVTSPSNPSVCFGITETSDQKIEELFKYLQSLHPMDKHGSMSGNCDFETTQMEYFLEQNFGFENLPGEHIVQGVRSFKLGKHLDLMDPKSTIHFPKNTTTPASSFVMSVDEIRRWQSSYVVYADQNQNGMSKEFLHRALQGQSQSGSEAFLMKFVVRISQCPILMEFDGQVIPRDLHEPWPNNIRLVSVTGIDFAGRIHDVDDICGYVVNWPEIYEIDPRTNLPYVYNGRDFRLKANARQGQLNESRLQRHLKRMARLRLRACDEEQVQIVVETGIGLGVFAGKYIGIDETVRRFSARAIREVLEEDGNSYQHIRAIVFALPIFDRDVRNGRREDTYHAFEVEFGKNTYQGCIPVLIADQDMHRLTVAIARKNFRVSELNPADSHGVFGEYWQNRGPAVEEKLALTTVGLLVQHHLINPYVFETSHYHLI
jgi:hypothetical protein